MASTKDRGKIPCLLCGKWIHATKGMAAHMDAKHKRPVKEQEDD